MSFNVFLCFCFVLNVSAYLIFVWKHAACLVFTCVLSYFFLAVVGVVTDFVVVAVVAALITFVVITIAALSC